MKYKLSQTGQSRPSIHEIKADNMHNVVHFVYIQIFLKLSAGFITVILEYSFEVQALGPVNIEIIDQSGPSIP